MSFILVSFCPVIFFHVPLFPTFPYRTTLAAVFYEWRCPLGRRECKRDPGHFISSFPATIHLQDANFLQISYSEYTTNTELTRSCTSQPLPIHCDDNHLYHAHISPYVLQISTTTTHVTYTIYIFLATGKQTFFSPIFFHIFIPLLFTTLMLNFLSF